MIPVVTRPAIPLDVEKPMLDRVVPIIPAGCDLLPDVCFLLDQHKIPMVLIIGLECNPGTYHYDTIHEKYVKHLHTRDYLSLVPYLKEACPLRIMNYITI